MIIWTKLIDESNAHTPIEMLKHNSLAIQMQKWWNQSKFNHKNFLESLMTNLLINEGRFYESLIKLCK